MPTSVDKLQIDDAIEEFYQDVPTVSSELSGDLDGIVPGANLDDEPPLVELPWQRNGGQIVDLELFFVASSQLVRRFYIGKCVPRQ